jgi:hypothetical protein
MENVLSVAAQDSAGHRSSSRGPCWASRSAAEAVGSAASVDDHGFVKVRGFAEDKAEDCEGGQCAHELHQHEEVA